MVLVISNCCLAAFLKDTFNICESHKIPVYLPFLKRLGANMSCIFLPTVKCLQATEISQACSML